MRQRNALVNTERETFPRSCENRRVYISSVRKGCSKVQIERDSTLIDVGFDSVVHEIEKADFCVHMQEGRF